MKSNLSRLAMAALAALFVGFAGCAEDNEAAVKGLQSKAPPGTTKPTQSPQEIYRMQQPKQGANPYAGQSYPGAR
jgi:PBP1b-binding outer membrane lipoprotein LpoB